MLKEDTHEPIKPLGFVKVHNADGYPLLIEVRRMLRV